MIDTTTTQRNTLESFGEMKMGGAGGSLEHKEEQQGESVKGMPEAEPAPTPTKEKNPKQDLIALKNPPKVHVVKNEPQPPKSPAPSHRDSTRESPAVIGPQGDHPLGTGEKPSGGTGGGGIGFGAGTGVGPGYAVNGFGNRGWLVRPTAKYPDNAQSTGAVTLRFTAQPNGDITNITPVKQASPALVQAAMAGLRKARARPLPDGFPQVPQSYMITYTFDLK
jgi:TonB family protein